jgi:hypothetical protein
MSGSQVRQIYFVSFETDEMSLEKAGRIVERCKVWRAENTRTFRELGLVRKDDEMR